MKDRIELNSIPRFINELLILKAISSSDKHGYNISTFIEQGSENYFKMSYGTMYPILHSLEKQKYIQGNWSADDSKRKKKTYSITNVGIAYLNENTIQIKSFMDRLNFMLEYNNEGN